MSRVRRYRWQAALAICAGLLAAGCTHEQTYPGARSAPLATAVDLDTSDSLAASKPAKPAEELPAPRPVEEGPEGKKFRPGLQIPKELPGAEAPAVKLPPLTPKTEAKREQAMKELFPKLTPVGPEIEPQPGPDGRPLRLEELQDIASKNNPTLQRAAADVKAAQGTAIQAGLAPNPNAGYEVDQFQNFGPTAPNAGQQGFFVNQLIKTGGKLNLAKAAAQMDLMNAEISLRETQIDVTSKVRAGYFAVLVARENVKISRALVELTDEAYRLQTQLVRINEAAPYEPLQIYVQAEQARSALVQARNRYVAAWKQLAATLGKREMPPTALAGRANAPVPKYCYGEALQRILRCHTDVRQAENTILKARYNLKLAETNRRPDVITSAVWQYDDAAHNMQLTMQLGFSGLPVWDQNQGNILQAKSQLARSIHDLEVTRNDLTTRLADAFERYESNRVLVANYRDKILTSQVRAYRSIRDRYQVEPEKVGFVDVVQAQQTLGTVLATYLQFLAAEWQAVVDVAMLLQTNELYVEGQAPCDPGADVALPELLHGTLPAVPAAPAPAVAEAPPAVSLGTVRALP